MAAKSQIQVTVSKICEIGAEKSFILELDSEMNEGKNTFQPNDFSYVRCFPALFNPSLAVNIGEAHIIDIGISLQVEEVLTFARSDNAKLRYPFYKNFEYEWIGKKGPIPKIDEESTILLGEIFSGILKVKYLTLFDRIEVYCNQEATILLEAFKEDRYGYITIDYKPEKKDVYLIVKDACTRNIISGVSVWVDGNFVGLTDSQGRIYLGKLRVGKHSLKMSKHGYQDSDSDTIANDYFTVT